MWRSFLDGDDYVSAPLFTLALVFWALAVVLFVVSLFTGGAC